MRNEPNEIKLTVAAKAPRTRRRKRAASNIIHAPMAIDEAFADLNAHSIGEDTQRAGGLPNGNQQQALIATLISQLESLDRQRQQLASLLEGIRS